jgi:hypothetical protein
MKQVWVLTVCLLASSTGASAQFLGGFFNQAATQIKLYGEQIAALELFVTQLEKGYQIVETGINDIGAIRQGEFNLHQAFFSSLLSINPSVAKMEEVPEILLLQASIAEGFSTSLDRWRKSGRLSPGDLSFIGQVYSTVCQQALEDVQDLLTLTTADQLKMTDGERIARIGKLDREIKDTYAFVQGFSAQVDGLTLRRGAGSGDGQVLMNIYDLK